MACVPAMGSSSGDPAQPTPIAEALIITAVLVGIAAALSWLIARFVASRRTVIRVVAVLIVLMLVPATVWAIVFPDDSTYLARTASLGESDVLDYQKIPAREVPNSADAFDYPKNSRRSCLVTSPTDPVASRNRPIWTTYSPPVTPRRSW